MFVNQLSFSGIDETFLNLKLGEFLIKVAGIIFLFDGWNIRSSDLLLQQVFNIQVSKPTMGNNIVDSSFFAKSLCFVFFEKLADKILRLRAHFKAMLLLSRPPNGTTLNQIVHLMLILIVEWWNTNYHLIDQNSKSPPI